MLAALLLHTAWAGPPVPLYAASKPCADAQFPLVAGDELIACGKRRQPTTRIKLPERTVLQDQPIYERPNRLGLEPPPLMGTSVATTANGGVAWVTEGNKHDREVWWRPSPSEPPRPLDVGPGEQHQAIAAGVHVAWVASGDIKVWNTATDERQTISAHTGFNAPPSLYSGVVCWEHRGPADVDIHCSDGKKLTREGHQTHPHRYDDTLFFREDGLLWVWEFGR
jgi:hypothetical protein